MTTSAMAPPRCSPRSTRSTDRSSQTCMPKHRHQEWIRFLNLIKRQYPDRQGDSHHLRQLRHPQTPQGHRLAHTQHTLSCAFHADQRILAEHGRAFLSRHLRAKTPARRIPLGRLNSSRPLPTTSHATTTIPSPSSGPPQPPTSWRRSNAPARSSISYSIYDGHH